VLLRAIDAVAVVSVGVAALGFWLLILVLLFTDWGTGWLLRAIGIALIAAFLAAAAGGRIRDWLSR
jgi:hypothetical protein